MIMRIGETKQVKKKKKKKTNAQHQTLELKENNLIEQKSMIISAAHGQISYNLFSLPDPFPLAHQHKFAIKLHSLPHHLCSLGAISIPLDLLVVEIDANHGFSQSTADVSENIWVAVVRDSLDDGPGPPCRVAALENTRADEDAVAAELHHQRGIGRRGDSSGGELDDGEPSELLGLHDEVVGGGDLLGEGEDLVVVHVPEDSDVAHDGPDVAHGLNDVAGAGLALGADHGGALTDAAEGLAEVAAAADEGDPEVVLVDVVLLVGDGQDLALVDVVDADGLEDLGLHEVADAGLGHDGDGHRLLDLLDQLWVAHAGHAALGPDVGRDALQGHDGACPGLLRQAGLLGVDHVHYNAAAEHLGQAHLHRERGLLRRLVYGAVAVDGDYSGVGHLGERKMKKEKMKMAITEIREMGIQIGDEEGGRGENEGKVVEIQWCI